ncbi:MAG: MAPEG family protein [Asticcacaulis sp.]
MTSLPGTLTLPGVGIFWPMATLAFLTFAVLFALPLLRFRAVFIEKVRPSAFRYGDSDAVPDLARRVSRNFSNLTELPVLFYAVCILALIFRQADATMISLAWAFTGLRIAHTLIHVTFNHVLIRLAVFATAAGVLLAMWIRLILALS